MADDKDLNIIPAPPNGKTSKVKKKGKGKLFAFLIFLLIIGGCAAVIYFNAGGFREDVIMPYLRNAPIIGGFLPAVVEEEEELSPEELMRRYTILSQQLESVQTQLAIAVERNTSQENLITYLRSFEEAWQLYREVRARLEQVLALGDPVNFIDFVEFFNFVSEDVLMQLYMQAREMAEFNEETRSIVATLNNMDESGAGEVLENLMTANLDLMVRALRMMSPTRRAEIFDTLEADVVTRMILFMSQYAPVFEIAVPPDLPEFPPPMPTLPEGLDIFEQEFWFEALYDAVPEEIWNLMPEDEWQQAAYELYESVWSGEFWFAQVDILIQSILDRFEVAEAEEENDLLEEDVEAEEE